MHGDTVKYVQLQYCLFRSCLTAQNTNTRDTAEESRGERNSQQCHCSLEIITKKGQWDRRWLQDARVNKKQTSWRRRLSGTLTVPQLDKSCSILWKLNFQAVFTTVCILEMHNSCQSEGHLENLILVGSQYTLRRETGGLNWLRTNGLLWWTVLTLRMVSLRQVAKYQLVK